ncbi:YbfB/YjiJ family MFS transporter [Lentzea sp. BCCO 10_0856]|uniref:YbfB/YjiJ family MFS transporter n=1 Tax=Lentzea miocenica TaxID=3095431 RepID=A0ABU4SSB1_9PSEU|nr:YbfB/YjiJ family MFS transporter [Lentzea sp. BCCO 10_0856]MDX8028788.1 YbfB/YjiJ family MFS transporter [Lentzea sp. BCCO 10_0856]
MSAREAGAALAAAMGIGRFVYTPILPLMTSQAGLSAASAASLATANYLGYFAGALATIVRAPSRTANRVSLVLLVATLAGMPLTHSMAAWFVLRLLAGIASAVVFVAAVNAGPGWGLSGVGIGIALSGLIVLAHARWEFAWWVAAALSALLTVLAWPLQPEARKPQAAGTRKKGFGALFTSYTLEGVGYIIAGTFLVAAIGGPLGSSAWVLVGVAAALSVLITRGIPLPVILAVQAMGIALPALIGGTTAALVSVVLFGGTFLTIAASSLKTGADLGFPRAAAVLTTGYSAGQIIGPLVATPLLHHGYHQALLLAAGIVAAAALTAPALPSRRRAATRTPPHRTPAEPVE